MIISQIYFFSLSLTKLSHNTIASVSILCDKQLTGALSDTSPSHKCIP